MIAPWPLQDLDLAREHVLEGADPVRRAELDGRAGCTWTPWPPVSSMPWPRASAA